MELDLLQHTTDLGFRILVLMGVAAAYVAFELLVGSSMRRKSRAQRA